MTPQERAALEAIDRLGCVSVICYAGGYLGNQQKRAKEIPGSAGVTAGTLRGLAQQGVLISRAESVTHEVAVEWFARDASQFPCWLKATA